MRNRGAGGTAGFTMMELMVVLIILSLALAVMVPRIGAGWRRMEDRDFLQTFVQTLRQGRLVAMNTGQVVLFRVRGGERAFGIEEYMQPIPENVDIFSDDLETDPETKDKVLIFFPDGSMTGGIMEIVFDQRRSFQISMHPLSGNVQWYKVNR